MQIVEIVLRWFSEHVLGAKISLGWLLLPLLLAVLLPVPMKYHFLEAITWEPETTSWPWDKQEMTGYYYSYSPENPGTCGSEHLMVSRFYGTVYAQSRATGLNGGTGEDNFNGWTYNGGFRDGDYYLRYRPASIFGQGSSFGLSYALRNPKEAGVLFGEWIGIDTESHDVVRCPYVLTSGPPAAGVSCEDAWPAELNHKRYCEVVQEREPTPQGPGSPSGQIGVD